MPCFRVAVEDGQPEHEPFMWRNTMPSLKPRNVMSPPSLATAGRTRVSISSLIMATVSASSLSKNSSTASDACAATLVIGAPDIKCSMMAPRIAGLMCCHSASDFVTVMKSLPRNTPATPGTPNSRSASGDFAASAALGMSRTPSGNTGRPGRNFKVAGFGVASVWMNISSLHCRFGFKAQGQSTTDNQQHGNFSQAGQQPHRSSTHRVDLVVVQMPGHDRHRNRKRTGGAAEMRDQRPRPFAAHPCGEHQHGYILVFLDQLEDFFGDFAFADHAFRGNAGDAVRAGRKSCELRVGFLVGLGAHNVGDAQPLLAMITGFDDAQQNHTDADAGRTAARVIHGAVAFGRVVDDHQVFRLVTGLVAPSLAGHRTGSSDLLGIAATP